MNTPIRIGIVGCGAVAESIHLPTATSVRNVQVTALIDPNDERTLYLKNKFHIPFTSRNLNGIVSEIDAVIICSPPHLHMKLAKESFSYGLHVLCEKPMANTVHECEQMIAAGKEANLILAMAHIYRFYPSRKNIRKLIMNGELGMVKSVTVEQGNPYSWQTVSGYNMNRDLVPGGVLIDAGIHPLDTLLWWFKYPSSIKYEDDALGGLESNVRLWLTFKNNVKGFLRLSRTCSLSNLFSIEYEKAKIQLSPYNPCQYELHCNGKIETMDVSEHKISAEDCARHQLTDFTESILYNRQPAITGEEGMQCIRLIEECYKIKKQRPLPVKAPIPGVTF